MNRLNLTLDIKPNNIGRKRVNLRSSLVVATLINHVKDKFNLDGSFVLHPGNLRQALPMEAALDELGVPDGSVLVVEPVYESTGTLELIQRGERQRLSRGFQRVYLAQEGGFVEYDLAWQPAIIGRRDRRDPSHNRLLAVNLEDAEEAPTVSRHHACITEAGGQFFLESINLHNATFLNDTRLRMGVKSPLPPGSRIGVGRVVLTFNVIS